jgi:predicted ATPase/class 3 adenylate cyclase
MSDQPTGTVTLLFSDIEGSTALLQRVGTERYAEALHLHRRLFREAFDRHGGYEVDAEGDAFFVSFASASEAVVAAAEAQRALAAAEWPDEGSIRVRMGLHTGEPLAVPPKYVGLDVHRAARILAAAHGGQVLVSQTTRELVDAEMRDLGDHRLKDLSQRQRIYQLVIEGLPGEFPPPRTLENRPTNLPVVATPLVGRVREIEELAELLSGSARLVTLTGPGGSGKTRLALQVAAEVVDAFADGVFLVALAALSDPELVLPTIAQTLAVSEQPSEPLEQTLGRFLSEREVLLLLDNVEQVVEAAPTLAGLLADAPGLRLLVTSREPLRVPGEREYPLEPLPVPGVGESVDAAGLSEFDAVSLFIERALAVRPEFGVTNENAPAVAEICARLDGLPLAIELAAARVRLLSPKALLTRLDERLALLTGGARGAPERQQTLRAAIDWSYRLLSEPERRLFARLGVFVGGCRIEQAEVVAGDNVQLGLDLLDGLQSLVEKSLLRRRDDSDGEPRFWMLETIREFALDALGAELSKVTRAHAMAYLTVAEGCKSQEIGPEASAAYALLEAERPNLRAAFDWAVELQEIDVLVRLWVALGLFWTERGHLHEAKELAQTVLTTVPVEELDPAVQVDVFGWAFWAHETLGEQPQAQELARKRMDAAERSGDAGLLSRAAQTLAASIAMKGDRQEALRIKMESVTHARRSGDPFLLSVALGNLADGYEDIRDYRACRETLEETLALNRQLGDPSHQANTEHNLAQVLLLLEESDEARRLFSTALPVLHEHGLKVITGHALQGFAVLALRDGQVERATRLFAASEKLHKRIGFVPRAAIQELVQLQFEPITSRRGEPEIDRAWAEGEAMTADEAVAYALAEAATNAQVRA